MLFVPILTVLEFVAVLFAHARGPVCYTCQQQADPAVCGSVTVCNSDEACHLSRVGKLYDTECVSKKLCEDAGYLDIGPVQIVGRRSTDEEKERRSSQVCTKCCSIDLCNLDNCSSTLQFHTHTTYTPPTSVTISSSTVMPCVDHVPQCTDAQYRDVICKHQSTAKKFCPKSCGLCTTTTSPTWSTWTTWTACTVSCGTGVQMRQRTCPVQRACAGSPADARACALNTCQVPITTPKPSWTTWGSWGACSSTCGNTDVQSRQRNCPVQGACPGMAVDARICTLKACPVPTNQRTWGAWGSWTTCTKTCGSGTHIRSRSCPDQNQCLGTNTETIPCNTATCPHTGWSAWTPWSCSVTCGTGTKGRTRTCASRFCPGQSEGYGLCVKSPCRGGTWSPWGAWAQCPGGGRIRQRTCSPPRSVCPDYGYDYDGGCS